MWRCILPISNFLHFVQFVVNGSNISLTVTFQIKPENKQMISIEKISLCRTTFLIDI